MMNYKFSFNKIFTFYVSDEAPFGVFKFLLIT